MYSLTLHIISHPFDAFKLQDISSKYVFEFITNLNDVFVNNKDTTFDIKIEHNNHSEADVN